MSNIWTARQRLADKKWDYSVGSDESGVPHAVGYCAGWHDHTPEERQKLTERFGEGFLKSLDREKVAQLPFKEKYHTEGHATANEAIECYHEFLLDQQLRFSDDMESQKKCKVCGAWTTHRAYLLGDGAFCGEVVLCQKDATRENVSQAIWPKKT